MDDSLYFTEHHHQVREMVREFSRTQIAPVAQELDRTSTFPWDNIKTMGELGLLGVPWSEELGGAGMDQLSYYITIHEMAKVDASHALTISAHTNLGTSPIVEFGTEEQKRRYVPLLASGRVLGGFGLTEPGAGSDAGGTATTAVDKGDHYLLNGSKIFITHAGVGEIFSVTARTEPGRGNKGITSFIVTKDTVDLDEGQARLGVGHAADLPKTRGVRAGKKEDKMGWRASDTRELIFEDAVVPKENVLGQVGYGFVNFLKTLDAGRIGIAALSLGIAEGAYDEALRVCRGPEAVRAPDRKLPGRELPAGRHGARDRGRHPPALPRRLAQAERASRSRRKRPWPSCSAPSWPCGPPPRRSRSSAGTATPPTIRSSG